MKITDFLTPEMICPALGGETKGNVLKELAGVLPRSIPKFHPMS